MNAPAAGPDPLDEVARILTSPTPEGALAGGARLVAAAVGALAALFALDRRELTAEAWSTDDRATVERYAPIFRAQVQAAIESGGRPEDRRREPAPEGLPLCAGLVGPGEARWAFCCIVREGADPERVETQARRLGELVAARIEAQRRVLAAEAERDRYERWFRTLDQQLRLLERERQKFSAVVSQSDLHVYVADVHRTIRWTNKSMTRGLLGGTPDGTWIGRSCCDVCASVRRGRAGTGTRGEACPDCPLAHALSENETAHQELHAGSGTAARTLYVTALPIRSPDGVPNEVMVMLQDLTDLRVLRRSESRYRRLFEHSANAIVMVRPVDHRIVLANAMAGVLLGADPMDLAGLALPQLHAGSEWTRIGARYGGSEAESPPEGFECVLRTRRGEERTAIAFATRFDLDDEEVVMIEYLDITARRQVEQALWERDEQLRQSQKMDAVGKLAGGMAHDFNNLLSVIMGRTELLQQQFAADDARRKDLVAIHSASTHGAWLVRQLLAFSRQGLANPEVLDLRAIVSGLHDLLHSLIGEKILLEIRTDAGPAPVQIDRAQIEQVLVNLAINARDAMPAGGTLLIEVDTIDVEPSGGTSPLRPGRHATISVTDTGHGMDESTRARLFEPFFTTKGRERSSGLGLSVVYGIVTQAGGHVTVASEPGRGTTVRVYLQRAAENQPAPPASAPATPARILLVEDNEAVRQVAREALEIDGYEVVEAAGGPEALELVERWEGPLDLVISDVVMPRMSGGDLVRRLVARRPELKVLLISGYTDDAMVRQGVEAGVPFLQKPFSLEALAFKVRSVLDSPTACWGADPSSPRA